MVEGKARLTREDYCDGLGDCLPACPAGAIAFEEREAPAYNEAAVRAAKDGMSQDCPGMRMEQISTNAQDAVPNRLMQWPVQIKLAPIDAPYFSGVDLLVAADCTAYAYGNFHRKFMCNRITLIGCPKLDATDYSEKLAQIIANNSINNVTVVRMEVPCCGGIENAVKQASGKPVPWNVVTISTDGKILEK